MNHTFPDKKYSPNEYFTRRQMCSLMHTFYFHRFSESSNFAICHLVSDRGDHTLIPPVNRVRQIRQGEPNSSFHLGQLTFSQLYPSGSFASVQLTSRCQFPNSKSHILYTESHTKFDILLSLPLVQRGWAIFRWHMS